MLVKGAIWSRDKKAVISMYLSLFRNDGKWHTSFEAAGPHKFFRAQVCVSQMMTLEAGSLGISK